MSVWDISLNIKSWLAPVNGTKGDARHTFCGAHVDDLASVFARPITSKESWAVTLEKMKQQRDKGNPC